MSDWKLDNLTLTIAAPVTVLSTVAMATVTAARQRGMRVFLAATGAGNVLISLLVALACTAVIFGRDV